jgi:hypothetical protein
VLIFLGLQKILLEARSTLSDEGLFQSQLTLDYAVPTSIGTSVYLSGYSADSFEKVYGAGIRRDMECGTIDLGYQHSEVNQSAVGTNSAMVIV